MIILASQSPRRHELLEQIGCSFKVIVSAAEEVNDQSLNPEKLVMENARLKAEAVAAIHPEFPVLGADTVVALEGKIYGKPHSNEEAKTMLSSLSGRSHQVSTGIAFVYNGKLWQAVESTQVEFDDITQHQIAAYVATGEPADKAGAYAIQGMAAAFIKGISGSYSNVVGLPLNAVCRLAEKAGVDLYGNGKGVTK